MKHRRRVCDAQIRNWYPKSQNHVELKEITEDTQIQGDSGVTKLAKHTNQPVSYPSHTASSSPSKTRSQTDLKKMANVLLNEYEPAPGDSLQEARNMLRAEVGMLQWLTRGHETEQVDETARANAYYNNALWSLVLCELILHMDNPEPYHIVYAKHLILNLLQYRHVPGDERGVILRSEVQPFQPLRRKRGKHRSRTAVPGNPRLISETTRAVDESLHQAVYNRTQFILLRDSPKDKPDSGKSDILMQCAHGPCQRYISVHKKSAWCENCEAIELHASFMVFECSDGIHDQCTQCLDDITEFGGMPKASRRSQ